MRHAETGSALLMAMAGGAVVSALAAAVVAVVMIEEAVEANHRRGVQALYAADGLLAGVVAELSGATDWNALVDGSGFSRFQAGPAVVTLPDGSVVDVEAETRTLAAGRDVTGESPWRPFARGWLGELVGAPERVPRLYLVAWIRGGGATEPDPGSSEPAGRRLVVRAAAFGSFRVERAVEATLVGEGAEVRMVAWNVVR